MKTTAINKNCKNTKSPRFSGGKLILLLALALIVIAVIGIVVFSLTKSVDIQTLTAQAVANNLSADTYRFHSRSVLHIGSEERCFADLEGEKSGARDRHIKGTLVGTDMEIFFVDGTLYRRDTLNGSWVGLAVGELDNAVNIMAELEPALNFAFEEMGEITALPQEKLDGTNCYVASFAPTLCDEWIRTYFGDITYKLWIKGKKEPQIVKAEISGRSLENPDAVLNISLEYADYGADIVLEPPC